MAIMIVNLNATGQKAVPPNYDRLRNAESAAMSHERVVADFKKW